MAGLEPAIHMDGRVKPAHGEGGSGASVVKLGMHHVVGNRTAFAFPSCHSRRGAVSAEGRESRSRHWFWVRHLDPLPLSIAFRHRSAGDDALRASVVKPEMHHVAVGDDVVFAFQAEFSRVARAGFALARDIVGKGDGFGADETLLEIGVDHACRLWGA
jgi:hypothetical protein